MRVTIRMAHTRDDGRDVAIDRRKAVGIALEVRPVDHGAHVAVHERVQLVDERRAGERVLAQVQWVGALMMGGDDTNARA